MQLIRLTINNFRQFYGQSVIDFASPGDRNVTILLGENAAGKTTFIYALRWCLHESKEFLNPNDILNHTAFEKAEVGHRVSVEVSLQFEHESIRYVATRTSRYKKRDGGQRELVEEDFRLQQRDGNGEARDVAGAVDRIQEIISPQLAPFFFFEGESAGHWATKEGADSLKRGVADCLNISILENALKHLDKTERTFQRELKKVAKGDAEKLESEIQELLSEKEDAEKALAREEEELEALRKRRRQINEQLKGIQETQPLIQRLELQRQRAKDLEALRTEAEERIKSVLGKHGFLAFCQQTIDATEGMIRDAYRRDQLPARIKPGFIDELLHRERCICGSSLADGSVERTELVAWRQQSGLDDVSEALQLLRGQCSHLKSRWADAEDRLFSERETRARIIQERAEVQGEIADLERKLINVEYGVDDITELQRQWTTVEADVSTAQTTILQLKKRIGTDDYANHSDSLSSWIRRKEERRDLLNRGNEKARLITTRIRTTKRLSSSVRELRDRWLTIVQKYLDSRIKEVYDEVGQLDRMVSFDEQFRLSMKESVDGQWVDSAFSGANQKVLALCFIATFIELARRIRDDDSEKDSQTASLVSGAHFPMVMDAPFAKMDSHFCRTVPDYLSRVVPQLVIISSQKQWRGEVEAALSHRVSRAYVVHLHSSGAGSSKSAEFRGQSIPYVSHDPEASPDYSMIERLEVH
jgi:DNA sulfur modification protein DndD